jgi:hypothetical protein
MNRGRAVLWTVAAIGAAAVACRVIACRCRAPITGVAVQDAHPGMSYSPESVKVPLERDAATGIERGRLVLLGRTYAVRVDAADPRRSPRIEADLRGDGVAFDGVVTGRWCEDPPRARIGGDVTFVLPASDGGVRDYRVSFEYGGGADGLSASASTWVFGDADLGGRRFRYALLDRDLDGSFADVDGLAFLVDRDGDGRFDGGQDGEEFQAANSFNLGTGAYFLRSVSEDASRVEFGRALWPKPARPYLGKGDAAPAVEGTDLDGKPISLDALHGRKTLLVFWASW